MAKFNLIEYRFNENGVTRPLLDEQVIASFASEKEADEACDSARDAWAYHNDTGGVSYFYEEVEGDDSPLSDNSYAMGYSHACGYHD